MEIQAKIGGILKWCINGGIDIFNMTSRGIAIGKTQWNRCHMTVATDMIKPSSSFLSFRFVLPVWQELLVYDIVIPPKNKISNKIITYSIVFRIAVVQVRTIPTLHV